MGFYERSNDDKSVGYGIATAFYQGMLVFNYKNLYWLTRGGGGIIFNGNFGNG